MLGPPSAERITPRHLALTPPTTLLLEIQATGFTGIAWLRNGTVMHEFPRLQLKNFSKTFRLSPTEVDDYDLYQADFYTVDDRVLSVDFLVGEFGKPHLLVMAYISAGVCVAVNNTIWPCCPVHVNIVCI